MVVNILKKKRPYIFGWELSPLDHQYDTLTLIDLYINPDNTVGKSELVKLIQVFYFSLPEDYKPRWFTSHNEFRTLIIDIKYK